MFTLDPNIMPPPIEGGDLAVIVDSQLLLLRLSTIYTLLSNGRKWPNPEAPSSNHPG
jgi:hypothetical protein